MSLLEIYAYWATPGGTAVEVSGVGPPGPPGSGGELLTGLTLWVDGVNGDDGTAARGDAALPYATLAAARTAAGSGDLIRVRPWGTSYGTLTLKTGVNWHLDAGVTVGQVTDGGAACVCGVFGDGAVTGGVEVTNSGSVLTFRCRDISSSGDGVRVTAAARVIGRVAHSVNADGAGVYATGAATVRLTVGRELYGDSGDGGVFASGSSATAVTVVCPLVTGGISSVLSEDGAVVTIYGECPNGVSGSVRVIGRNLPQIETSGTLQPGTVYPVGGVSASFSRTWTTLTLQGVSGSGSVTVQKNGVGVSGSPFAFTASEADTSVSISMAVGDRLTATTDAAVYLGLAGVRG